MYQIDNSKLSCLKVAALLVVGLALASCANRELESFETLDESKHGAVVIGNAVEKVETLGTLYTIRFKKLDLEPGEARTQSAYFEVDRVAETSLSTFSVYAPHDYSEVAYSVLKLLPSRYVLYEVVRQVPFYNSVTFVCYKPTAPTFEVEAGEIIYLGDIILESEGNYGSLEIKQIARNDEAAREAIALRDGDPTKMQWRALGQMDYDGRDCH